MNGTRVSWGVLKHNSSVTSYVLLLVFYLAAKQMLCHLLFCERYVVNAPLLRSHFRTSVRPSVRLGLSVCLSVCLSVRLSVSLMSCKSTKSTYTNWYAGHNGQLWFLWKTKIFETIFLHGVLCTKGYEQIEILTNISLFSETIRHRAIVTMEDKEKVVYAIYWTVSFIPMTQSDSLRSRHSVKPNNGKWYKTELHLQWKLIGTYIHMPYSKV